MPPGDDGQIRHGAQAEVALTPVADDAPSENAEIPAPNPSPAKDQAQAMEVDDYAACPSQPSPVLLTTGAASKWGNGGGVRVGPPLSLLSRRPE